MENMAKSILDTQVKPGCVAIFWLAQAGFVFKTHTQKIIYTDTYLTDCVQRTSSEYGFGFKRLIPKLIMVDEVEADYFISTHSHQDHLDVDALPTLVKNKRIHFIGSPDCQPIYEQNSVPKNQYTILHVGEKILYEGFSLTGVYADHGESAPEALGLLFDFDGIRIWQVGDSAYRPEKWQDIFKKNIDVILPPINGAFGNLNSIEAAMLSHDSGAKVVIPCHFWMFALHYGSPGEFLDACKKHAPEVAPYLMTPGELLIYRR